MGDVSHTTGIKRSPHAANIVNKTDKCNQKQKQTKQERNANLTRAKQAKNDEYYTQNFHRLGLKRLISTCIAANGNRHGKLLIMNAGGVQRSELQGTGDFRTEEIRGYRDQADAVITNPPFSLLRVFVFWIMEAGETVSYSGQLKYYCFHRSNLHPNKTQ